MPPFSSSSAAPRVPVWDPLVRVFHWSLVAGFATAYLVEDQPLTVHVWAGYLVLMLIGVRVIWGLIGSPHARFSDFVRGPQAVLAYLRDTLRGTAPRYLGHNPAGGAMVIALLLMVGLTGLSGLMVYGAEEGAGPLAALLRDTPRELAHGFEEAHEFLANGTLVLVLLHLAGVAFSSLAHRENLVRAMIFGTKRSDVP